MRCLVLIDDYDSILIAAKKNGCFDEISYLLESMLSSTLKNNSYVKSSFWTGVIYLKNVGFFSDGLNHMDGYTLFDKSFEQCFGFSEG